LSAAAAGVDTDSHGSSDADSPPVAPALAAAAAAAGRGGGKKQRRSWKQHRVEALDVSCVSAGLRRLHDLYACDQCDKMFGKQSSLARHKYEHSGTHRALSLSLSLSLSLILDHCITV